MKPILDPFYEHAYALLRISTGLMFMIHGTQKILGWPESKMHPPLLSMAGVGGLLELICGALITVGLFASIAAFVASGEMAVAYWMVHAPGGLLPIINKGELAAVYSFVFLFIAANGSGIWSVDHLISGKRVRD